MRLDQAASSWALRNQSPPYQEAQILGLVVSLVTSQDAGTKVVSAVRCFNTPQAFLANPPTSYASILLLPPFFSTFSPSDSPEKKVVESEMHSNSENLRLNFVPIWASSQGATIACNYWNQELAMLLFWLLPRHIPTMKETQRPLI